MDYMRPAIVHGYGGAKVVDLPDSLPALAKFGWASHCWAPAVASHNGAKRTAVTLSGWRLGVMLASGLPRRRYLSVRKSTSWGCGGT